MGSKRAVAMLASVVAAETVHNTTSRRSRARLRESYGTERACVEHAKMNRYAKAKRHAL